MPAVSRERTLAINLAQSVSGGFVPHPRAQDGRSAHAPRSPHHRSRLVLWLRGVLKAHASCRRNHHISGLIDDQKRVTRKGSRPIILMPILLFSYLYWSNAPDCKLAVYQRKCSFCRICAEAIYYCIGDDDIPTPEAEAPSIRRPIPAQ